MASVVVSAANPAALCVPRKDSNSRSSHGTRSSLRVQPLSAARNRNLPSLLRIRTTSSAAAAANSSPDTKEEVFFDGGPHYGDLVANLVFGFTLFWLPLTVAAVFRALFLRYRFTTYRVTILSGLTGGDRKDFKYDAIKDVRYVPRFIGEWGDVVITLKDDTKVELKSLPKFREIAKYCLEKSGISGDEASMEATAAASKKGFL